MRSLNYKIMQLILIQSFNMCKVSDSFLNCFATIEFLLGTDMHIVEFNSGFLCTYKTLLSTFFVVMIVSVVEHHCLVFHQSSFIYAYFFLSTCDRLCIIDYKRRKKLMDSIHSCLWLTGWFFLTLLWWKNNL